MPKLLLAILLASWIGRAGTLIGETIPEIVAKVKSAVCVVIASDESGKTRDFGTGFFVSLDGLFVTNKHVIEGAERVTIKAPNGDKFLCAGILAEPRGVDLAVLKINASGMTKVELGNSTDLVEGQRVLVIGTPEGLEGTVSDGIVAAIRNNPRMIQITAPISPGSSGSPVLDETGKVIGIATLQFKKGQNLNFAIPVEELSQAITSIDTNTKPLPLGPLVRHEIMQFKGHVDTVNSLAFSPDGRSILSGSFDGTARLWDVESGEEMGRFERRSEHSSNFQDYLGDIAVSPNGAYMLSAAYKSVRLWNLGTGRELRRLRPNSTAYDTHRAVFTPNSRYVIAGGNQGIIVIWQLETGQEITHFRNAEEDLDQVFFSPGTGSAIFVKGREWLSLRDVITGQEIRRFVLNADPGVEVAFSPDGRYLVSTEVSVEHNASRKVHRVIRLWDKQTGQEIREFAALTYGASIKAAFSRDSRYLLYAGDNDSSMRLCDLQTGSVICRFSPYNNRIDDEIDPGSIWSIAISLDGRFAASGHHDGTIRLWDLNIDHTSW